MLHCLVKISSSMSHRSLLVISSILVIQILRAENLTIRGAKAQISRGKGFTISDLPWIFAAKNFGHFDPLAYVEPSNFEWSLPILQSFSIRAVMFSTFSSQIGPGGGTTLPVRASLRISTEFLPILQVSEIHTSEGDVAK